MAISPGAMFRSALEQERPLQIVGVIHAYAAVLAREAGFRAIYLSGAGVANACHALPDLGLTSLDEVAAEVRKITEASDLPLLVDADTGWGPALNIARTVKKLSRAGAAGLHLEDQAQLKRCGHRPGKELVSADEMADRITAAVNARTDASFVVMARTDARANEGLNGAIDRACRYRDAGADMIFAEALTSLEEYQKFCAEVRIPVLANLTEFGKTPLLTAEELRQAGVRMALYPLSAFRAMNKAALEVYRCIRNEGTQRRVVPQMQTREELYQTLNYQQVEESIDRLLRKGRNHE